jgi:hypothetical protein
MSEPCVYDFETPVNLLELELLQQLKLLSSVLGGFKTNKTINWQHISTNSPRHLESKQEPPLQILMTHCRP